MRGSPGGGNNSVIVSNSLLLQKNTYNIIGMGSSNNTVTLLANSIWNAAYFQPTILVIGGGESTFFAKPKFQAHVPGKFRQTPDISMNADPQTGNEIIITDPTLGPTVEVFGGTSLSCPMFSAVWAIANQAAGVPLGQAAPWLYALPAGDILDVTAVSSPLNVTGVIFNPPSPPMFESANALVQPLGKTTKFVSALYNSPFSTRWFDITFGTDSSFKTGPGWDNVTGLGTPNGQSFIQGVVGLSTPPAH